MFSNEPWGEITPLLKKPSRSKVTCAISYIGTKAMDVLVLKAGDVLYCDASTSTIQQGYTDPDVLKKYMEMGVEVRSVAHLHMKTLIFKDRIWVGSMNASYSSKNSLREAGLMSRDRLARKNALESMELLGSVLVTPEMLPPKPKHTIRVTSPVLYEGPRNFLAIKAPLHILWGKLGVVSESEEAFLEKKEIEVRKQKSAIQISSMTKIHTDLVIWDGLKCRAGDWVLWTDDDEVFPPGEIIYLAKKGKKQYIWLAVPRTVRYSISKDELKNIFKKHYMRLGKNDQRTVSNSGLVEDIARAFSKKQKEN